MLKNIFFLLAMLLYSTNSYSQRNDNIWPIGYYIWGSNIFYSLDFSNGNPDTVSYQRKMKFFITNSSICDTAGNLEFYTNGVWVANQSHDTLYNSSGFNTGWATSFYQFSGMGFAQSCLILPLSINPNKYYLIYENADTFSISQNISDAEPTSLRYSLVDMSLDNNLGGIDSMHKNVNIINDMLIIGRITACKHANGRDWWVVVHKYYSDIYYKLLCTPNGILGPYSQHIGPVLLPKLPNGVDTDIDGMAVFSPDGTKYATVGPSNDIHLMDFDRCSGDFYNYQMIDLPDTSWSLGCSFSPNSRFLYTNTYLKGYQFDMQATDVAASKTTIATFDGFQGPSLAWFFINQLGPDGKIYIGTFNGNHYLHVINNPDSLGNDADFSQHSFTLPPNLGSNISLPNFPNYRLGRLIGSGCDTLTSIKNVEELGAIQLESFPNPLYENELMVKYTLSSNSLSRIEIINCFGQTVFSQKLPPWSSMQQLSLPNLSSGIYMVKLTSGEKSAYIKILKQ